MKHQRTLKEQRFEFTGGPPKRADKKPLLNPGKTVGWKN
jgi:hypothetical protein